MNDASGKEWGSCKEVPSPTGARKNHGTKGNDPHHPKLKELQLLMSDYVGIVRTNTRRSVPCGVCDLLHEETEEL